MMALDDLSDVTLVAGVPRSGKTEFALRTLIAAMRRYGDTQAVMTVSGRQIADDLGDRVIRELSAISQARPVTTLAAVAFRIVTAVRSHAGLPLPKLLNGAEQDVIIRRVLASHVDHTNRGDACAVCDLLRTYFAVADWSGMVADDSTDAFANQLRDMLARMNEIGAKPEFEDELIARAASKDGTLNERHERMRTQWRLAFALRAEYDEAIRAAYPGEYRLDASQLMVDAAATVAQAGSEDLPRLLIVDDFQDATLAGFDMLAALHERGVRLLLVGNPDESVQTFRGSYPEYLFNAAQSRLGARLERIDVTETERRKPVYRTLAASRVSLSIASTEPTDEALPNRPGKMPALPGALPIETVPTGGLADGVSPDDGSIGTAMYRSAVEELDDVVWKIKTEHLQHSRDWNDMAVIAHDNDTVRTFGERLRADGVPVRYSSVTRPLKDEPFVQGLFALIELAELKRRTIAASTMGLRAAGAYVRSRVALIMGSPLITVGGDARHEGRPARLATIESAMNALGSLAAVLESDDSDALDDSGRADVAKQALLPRLIADWRDYAADFRAVRESVPADSDTPTIAVDDSLISGELPGSADSDDSRDPADLPFGMEALYVLLLEGNTVRVLDAIASVLGADPQSKAFASLWKVLDKTIEAERKLISHEPQYVLDCAWTACNKAQVWQRVSLENSAAGRAANDRLDAAMRLFSYASGDESNGVMAAHTIGAFIEQVRALTIEADSLAHTAPIDQAVTLTTPTGAAGRHWSLVFLPALQQGQWPNLAPRNTLFGGESLADVMLHGELRDDIVTSAGRQDAQMAAVLASEQKSFLVALTRADECAVLSAVLNDDNVPSDFLYGYLPERFDRDRDADPEHRDYAMVGGAGEFNGLDADPRGLVAAARSMLATEPAGSAKAKDAAAALALLAQHGIAAADPAYWPFAWNADDAESSTIDTEPSTVAAGSTVSVSTTDPAHQSGAFADSAGFSAGGGNPFAAAAQPRRDASGGHDRHRDGDVVTLSPSAVDRLWACPVCWMLENRFAGPRPGNVDTNFGSIIHEVAQRATEAHLDLPQRHTQLSDADNIDMIFDWMFDEYGKLRGDLNAIADPEQRYRALRKDEQAAEALHNIATYFVNSNRSGYPAKNADRFEVGKLTEAEPELQFTARFGFDDVLEAYNAIEGVDPIGRSELISLMGLLVGGWPEDGMTERLTVRLTGRIDRLERRVLNGGGEQVRLIDYKTGKPPSGQDMFSDLQLVCYQLGLAFPEEGPRGAQAIAHMPNIGQSALFHVMHSTAPAPRGTAQGEEAYHQQALFANGSLNAGRYVSRLCLPTLDKLFVDDLDGAERPETVGDEHWRQFLKLRPTMAVWSLTMISRVFYAAAASRAGRITAQPTSKHKNSCRNKAVCPACAGEQNTVFERRVA
ncbi:PD-(D/E)XK nuclease family protein [Bifidobacterium moukalabense]|uniref:PD-(D/E)XK nuclease family protein n=1 Tax=Bifidobacterium moukalabense TaxID=1333651 RepID=UPI0010F875A0|nr:PD-(D/E)XK nuclease family protein [Bifidobacterium moukalabense]